MNSNSSEPGEADFQNDDPLAHDSTLAQQSNWSYEAAVAKIESIITRMEMGELEIAEVFEQFATAVEHLRQCESFLSQQQQKMDLMIETLLDEPDSF